MYDGNEVRQFSTEFEGHPLFIVLEMVGGIPQEPALTRDEAEADNWVREIVAEGMDVQDLTGVTTG